MEDDDWFFESISRYKNLNMFELEKPIQQVEPVGDSSICVSCSNSQQHQLLELTLPSTLLPQTNKTSDNITRASDTNMEIKCGTNTSKMCFQIKTISGHKVIVSHTDMKGVTLYGLSSDCDKIKEETCSIKCDLETPMMATYESHLCVTRKRADPMLLYDLNTEQCLECVKIDEGNSFECDERIVPMFLGPDVVMFGCQVTGGICSKDLRDPSGNQALGIPKYDVDLSNGEFWSFTSLFECSREFINIGQNVCCAKVSKSGKLLVYDTRNMVSPAYVGSLSVETKKDTPLQVRFKPCNKDWLSVSGFDSNVYVYELCKGKDSRLVFSHDGHANVDTTTNASAHAMVTSHFWSTIDNLIISSDNNGTVQMWQFQDKKSQV